MTGKQSPEYRLRMEHISKSFPGVRALDDVRLYVRPGSVHALVGENGAGKSTLMKCLFGIYRPDAGTIEIDGERAQIDSAITALKNGISMIHQELNPIPYRTIIENIWVGRYEKKHFMVDERRMREKTEALLADLEFDIDPRTLARNLSVSQLQAMEIAKAISFDARIIIMDEPTSSLTVAETAHLFKIIKRLRRDGISIIYISHKLEEIAQIADEITIMRDGKYVGNWGVDEISTDRIIGEMVGRSMDERFPPREHEPSGDVALRIEGFTSKNPRSFKDVSFELRRGEILGIGGLVGAQRTELVESIFGLRPLSGGRLYKDGAPIENGTPSRAIANGFGLLTEERRATGIVPMLSVQDNALIASYERFASRFARVIREKKSASSAGRVCESMNVKTPSMRTIIQHLSGGNQQKVLVGRWLLTRSNILILDEPTRGIDVGAKYEIYKIMRELAKAGNSIIMVSSEMVELLGMSDRIIVMCNGRMTGILDREDASQEGIMRLATQFAGAKA
jgi:methyl-galactoside transport system ATP-binding protein